MNHRQILSEGTAILQKAGIAEAGNDAGILFMSSFKMDRTSYLMKMSEQADEGLTKIFFDKIKRRANREPVQYIEGRAYFMGFEFTVSPAVLIPRFDTEILVENALKYIKKDSRVLDMCTGSGCIAISVSLLTGACVTGVDISEDALLIAGNNSVKNNADKVDFLNSNMFRNISGTYDFILSNPPYIKSADIEELEQEVKEMEPRIALDGYGDGLHFYRILAKESPQYLNEGGAVFFEIGYDQGAAVKALLDENGFTDTGIIKDLSGLDRVVCGWRK